MNKSPGSSDMHESQKSALLITAHPDDECMFFLPSIMHLQAQGYKLWALCLSTGNADGLGAIRAQEMYHACSLLGISRQCVTVVDDARLPDGMHVSWPPQVVAEHVNGAIAKCRPELVLTFDSGGVSGHPNHVSTSVGVREALEEIKGTDDTHLLMLETTSIFRKYLGPLDALFSVALSGLNSNKTCFIGGFPLAAWRALRAHRSQFVWFRKLFVLFSRYVYMNTLVVRKPRE